MTDANRQDIQVLNGLIQSMIDSAESYGEAAAETTNPEYSELYARREAERRALAEDLSQHVRLLGGEPQTSGSIIAKAQRALTDVKHALMRNEATVAGGPEQAEDAISARFDKAVADTSISATTRETIRRVHAAIRSGHAEMSELKHTLESRQTAESGLFPS